MNPIHVVLGLHKTRCAKPGFRIGSNLIAPVLGANERIRAQVNDNAVHGRDDEHRQLVPEQPRRHVKVTQA